MSPTKDMVFQRLGGEYQFVIRDADDLARILELDESHWVATSLPIESLICDETFLKLVDTDNNNRIRTDEMREAIRWLLRMLADKSRLAEETETLALDSIDTSHAEGKALHAAAQRTLFNLGKSEAAEITLDQVRDRKALMADAKANGDGVIPPEAADDPEVAAFISDIAGTIGAVDDASGAKGITAEALEEFLAEARDYLEWAERGRLADGEAENDILVWGADTGPCYDALAAVREKLDEYFVLCAMAWFDPRVADRVRLSEQELAQLDVSDEEALEARLAAAPIARPGLGFVLRFSDELNPVYRPKLETFVRLVLARTQEDADSLSRAKWEEIKALFAPYREWVEGKKGARVEPLGAEKLRAYLDGDCADKVRALIAEDAAVAGELADVSGVEKLILYQRWLMELANNFVSFPRFYDPEQRSMLEAGTLILDGRHFKLNLKVLDRRKHKTIAGRSNIFVMYVEVTRENGGEKFEVASAVTAGDMGDIDVGKRGIFITRDGRKWEATVMETIPNPVGMWEALKLPFKRLSDLVGKHVEKFSASRYADLEKKVGARLTEAEKTITTAAQKPAPAAPSRSSAARDLLLGGGVAIAALGSTFAYAASKLKEAWPWTILAMLGALLALITVPTVIVAVIKLRRRNMSALLEAGGWAVNARMRLSSSIGRLFTIDPPLPREARKRRFDMAKSFLRRLPTEGKKKFRPSFLIGLAVVLCLAAWLAYSYLKPKGAGPSREKPPSVPSETKPPAPEVKK